jgi:hypothetical protein
LQSLVGLEGSASKQPGRMQPTLPQNTGAGDMDLSAVQSMDWLFKKERIYLLAQFWQQVSDLVIVFENKKTKKISVSSHRHH